MKEELNNPKDFVKQQRDDLGKRCDEYQKECKRLREKVESYEKNHNRKVLVERIDKLEHEKKDYKERLTKCYEDNRHNNYELEKIRTHNQALQKSLDECQSEKPTVRKNSIPFDVDEAMRKKDKKINELEMRCDAIISERNRLTTEMKNLRIALSLNKTYKEKYKAELNNLKKYHPRS